MFGDVTETGDLILADEDKSEVEKPTAVRWIEDVTKLVTQLLGQYDKEGMLVTQLLGQYDKDGKLVTQLLDQWTRRASW